MRNKHTMEKALYLEWERLPLNSSSLMTVCENWNILVNLCLRCIIYKIGIIIFSMLIMLTSMGCEIKWPKSKQHINGLLFSPLIRLTFLLEIPQALKLAFICKHISNEYLPDKKSWLILFGLHMNKPFNLSVSKYR